jgi:microcystin-dependent protein
MIQPMNSTSMCSQKPVSRWFSPLLSANAWMGIVLAICLGALGLEVQAQSPNGFPPNLMTYQGYLVDANGNPLAPNNPINFTVVFRIYATSTGGSALWAESQTVTVDRGNFSVVLGEGGAQGSEPRPALSTVFTSSTASDLFIGITVNGLSGGNTEILPRLRLLTSPYSFLARAANGLAGSDGASLIASDAGRLRISQSLQSTGGNPRGTGATDLQTTRLSSSPGQVASGEYSAIGGGQNNTASSPAAVVTGGQNNTASGTASAVNGGDNNIASGSFSAVAGGQFSTASAGWTLAAGRRAKALHEGSIVFGDARDQDKSSTGNNQFIIGSSGGVAINTTPASGVALTVSGRVRADSAEFSSMAVTTLNSTSVSGYGTIPVGGIILWSGAVNAVPDGWALCNGTQNTPDLRGRFVMGGGGTRAVGVTGGAETVTLSIGQLPAHNHVVSGRTSSDGDHSHMLPRNYADDGNGRGATTTEQLGLWADSTSWSITDTRGTAVAGNHSHSFTVDSASTGSGQAIDKLPPFYVLAYIMRIR